MSIISCQRCQNIVKSHESLLDINASTYDLMNSIIQSKPIDNNKNYHELLTSQPRLGSIDKEEFKRKIHLSIPTIPENSIINNNSNNITDGNSSNNNTNENQLNSTIGGNGNFELNSTESFIILGKSQLTQSILNPYLIDSEEDNKQEQSNSNSQSNSQNNFNFSTLLTIQSQLFDKINESSDFNHPLCEECYDVLIKGLLRKKNEAIREKLKYKEYSTLMMRPNNNWNNNEDGVNVNDANQLENEIEKLKIKESSTIDSLKELEKQLESLKLSIKELEEEDNYLKIEEENYWNEFNNYELQLNQFEINCLTINSKYQFDLKQLEILHNTSIFNDLFHISQFDGIGTINGLRLGRLPPEHNTEWNEINAAWGQTVLALHVAANKLNFNFKKYTPYPNGSFSKILKENQDGTKEYYELFLPPESTFSRILLLRRYDYAMAGYLFCLEQIHLYIQTLDPKFKLPYKIDNDRINNLPIHFQFHNLAQWSKALRYTLRNTKSILYFLTSHVNASNLK
ncbi:APG6-domain-containing protein [Neoconidiobolus thromboides FSU 785]|nr:APG6-domain-containing protein [Neoconidiobolus thromboides FSU 785]